MKSILSRFAGPFPSSRGNGNDSMYRGKRECAKRKSPCPERAEAGNEKEKPPGFAWGLGNQNGISEEAASAGAGADASSSFGFALPLTEKSVITMETFS